MKVFGWPFRVGKLCCALKKASLVWIIGLSGREVACPWPNLASLTIFVNFEKFYFEYYTSVRLWYFSACLGLSISDSDATCVINFLYFSVLVLLLMTFWLERIIFLYSSFFMEFLVFSGICFSFFCRSSLLSLFLCQFSMSTKPDKDWCLTQSIRVT